MPEPLIDIRPDHWVIVRDILRKHVPQYDVWAFGSRAKWGAKEYSDLDLAVITDKPLGLSVSAALSDDFAESDLPFKVDVVDWATTSESFRKIIERDKVVVWKAAKKAVKGEVGEWQQFPLVELCSLITDGKHGDCENESGSGYFFLSVKDVFDNRLVYENARQITEQDFLETHRRTNLEPNDILFTNTGTIGRMAIAPDDPRTRRTTFQKSVAILKPRLNLVEPHFLYYTLKFDNARLSELAAGTTQKNLLLKDFRSFEVKIPDFPEQRAIAHILGTLDDKIELNRRMNETLEAMARALFKSWFVDFDPVRAKAEGRPSTSSGQAFPGLPKTIADQFPDSFEDSELGEIPKGWAVKTIGDLAEIVGGSTPSTKEPAYWDGGIHHWATPKDLSALRTPVLLNTERRITDVGLAQVSSGLLPPGTVLLSSRAPIGYLVIAEIPVAINQGFIAMKAKKSVSNLFLRLWASFAHEDILARANGSTFLEISKSNFRPIKLVAPPIAVFAAFDQLVRPIYGRVVLNERESRTLAALRDSLLPKLISGELRVKAAERIAAAAV
jgi:type I restriction enzyme S subunit